MDLEIINNNGAELVEAYERYLHEKIGCSIERITSVREMFRRLGYVDQSGVVCQKLGKDKQDDFVKRLVMNNMCSFTYNAADPTDIYIRTPENPHFYRRLSPNGKELVKIVNDTYEMLFHMTPPKSVANTVQNIMNNIYDEADLSSGYWLIGDNLFWDSEKGQFLPDNMLKGVYAYREISATSSNPKVRPEKVKESFDYWANEFAKYDGYDFDRFYTRLPREFDFMKVWADVGLSGTPKAGSVDKYWDLCIATSTNFMYNKPPKAYMLIGKPRGGKSTYIKTLHYLLGTHQTTKITLAGLGDWSTNNVLFGTLLNAPDEDPAEKLSPTATSNFKSIAAHEEMVVPVKNARRPLVIKPNFMLFVPKNSLPNFGADSDACTTRLRPIFFTADLSRLDNAPKDFIKETFEDNPENVEKFVGFLLYLAKYFEEHGMWWSQSMATASDFVSENTNSSKLYYMTWSRFYAGYSSFKLLWKDYTNFCTYNGYTIESRDALKQAFFIESQQREKSYCPQYKRDIWMYVSTPGYTGTKDSRLILSDEEYVEGYGLAKDMVLNGSQSFVVIHQAEAENKVADFSKVEQEDLFDD